MVADIDRSHRHGLPPSLANWREMSTIFGDCFLELLSRQAAPRESFSIVGYWPAPEGR
jgi:hypothetical protein